MRTVSVIIAAYNRCEDLKKVLEGLLAQRVEGKLTYEVIVVDNNSTTRPAGPWNPYAKIFLPTDQQRLFEAKISS